ncbi:MAG: hypothetical protein M9920_00635 [Verrucomicrobiae bacterium]|nr:hypothetical protein [Verrucomicrobiae bacterium]
MSPQAALVIQAFRGLSSETTTDQRWDSGREISTNARNFARTTSATHDRHGSWIGIVQGNQPIRSFTLR